MEAFPLSLDILSWIKRYIFASPEEVKYNNFAHQISELKSSQLYIKSWVGYIFQSWGELVNCLTEGMFGDELATESSIYPSWVQKVQDTEHGLSLWSFVLAWSVQHSSTYKTVFSEHLCVRGTEWSCEDSPVPHLYIILSCFVTTQNGSLSSSWLYSKKNKALISCFPSLQVHPRSLWMLLHMKS